MNFKLIGSGIFLSICAVILFIQLNWVYSVSAEDPLTSPITSPIVDETPTPTSTEIITPTLTDVPVTPTPQTEQAEAKKEESKPASTDDSKKTFTCTTAKPSMPVLIQAQLSGNTAAKIVWAKGIGAVTSYVIWYGIESGNYQYATPKIQGLDILSYTINQLEKGKTYYFRVQPYNECMPGEYSKEGKVVVSSAKSSLQMGAFYPENAQDKILTGISVTPTQIKSWPTPKVETPIIIDEVLGESYVNEEPQESFIEWTWNSITGFFKNLFS